MNCSGIRDIKRLGVLVDADEYYRAFFDVVDEAKSSVNILGWEFESKINLGKVHPAFPDNLRQFFSNLTKLKPYLKVNIQSWRSPMYLLFGRERFADFRWQIETPDNVDFHENPHPSIYGSYHEKLAIIDNCCAFLGGMDISRRRWDTSRHDFHNPLRKDGQGLPYFPIHDIQVVCSGEIVEELNRYMHQRNQNSRLTEKKHDLWPKGSIQEIRDIKGACSRTSQERRTFEIENLYLDAIQAAKDFIYIENQYFSHHKIIEALSRRLEEEKGPEIVIVLPKGYRGLFEKSVYLTQREKAFKRLKRSDHFNRLLIFFPDHKENERKEFIVVHSKLMIVDNSFITIGSANLNYRSMRVDNELNLSFEAYEARIGDFISNVLFRLLSEHLGTPIKSLQETFLNKGLIATIKNFKDVNSRTFSEMPPVHLRPIENFLRISKPMVDISYPIPKNYVFILFFTMILMGLIFMKDYIE